LAILSDFEAKKAGVRHAVIIFAGEKKKIEHFWLFCFASHYFAKTRAKAKIT